MKAITIKRGARKYRVYKLGNDIVISLHDLGWLKKGEMLPEMKKAARAR